MTWVHRHLGHTMDVHETHYQNTEDFIERVNIAKLLLIQDGGLVGKYKEKSLSDIEFSGMQEYKQYYYLKNLNV